MKKLIIATFAALAVIIPVLAGHDLKAEPASPTGNSAWTKKGRETGFPVPRFVSLKSREARMRIGPSTDYATAYIYSARGLPLEITEEYGHWRRVRDMDGASGWMAAALLSGDRTAVIGPWLKKPVPLRSDPNMSATVVATLQPRVLLGIRHCNGTWCEATLMRHNLSGYVDQASLWGVYPGETIR
ncbi:MAG: SH3 domain-containing protein [Neorhizobium sp.]|nr:SH3 domain-containing protein [Neorhizobium sp.]